MCLLSRFLKTQALLQPREPVSRLYLLILRQRSSPARQKLLREWQSAILAVHRTCFLLRQDNAQSG